MSQEVRPRRVRWTVFAALLLATLLWANRGMRFARVLSADESPTAAWARETAERFRKEDPQIAAHIEKMKRDQRELAVLRAIESAEGVSGLKRAAEGKPSPAGDLVRKALDPALAPDDDARAALLHAYGGPFVLLRRDGEDAGEISERLSSHAGKDSWEAVRDDPAALAVWEAVEDPALRKYYRENADALAEILVQLAAPENDARAAIRQALAAAKEFHPLPLEAYREHGAPAFLLFLPADRTGTAAQGLGPLLSTAVARGVPLRDALDVAAANAHFLLDRAATKGYAALAAELVDLHAARRWIWDLARTHPLALEADLVLPGVGERLLRNPALLEEGVLDFLFTWYEDEKSPKVLHNAALAVAEFGDLARFELDRHRGDPRLLKLLASQDHRVVAYAALRGDAGLDDAVANPRWIDKYFGADGRPVKNRWWEDIPIVGGPARVVSELAKGHPVSSGEWGWAALDVLDGGLLVLSLGTSAELTAAKEAVKGGAKKVFRETARGAARTGGRAGVRAGTSFLQRVAARGGVLRLFAWASLPLRWAGAGVVRAARAVAARWTAMSPGARKWIVRGLLGVTLFESLRQRTWPLMKRLAREAPEAVAREVGDLMENGVKGLAAAVDDVLGRVTGATGNLRANVVYVVVLVLLGAATLASFPRRPKAVPA